MSFVSQLLKQKATYWAPGTPDGFGGISFGAPTKVKVHWEDRQDQYFDRGGDVRVSRAVVTIDRPVAIGGYLYLGTTTATDPTSVGAFEIQQITAKPDLRAVDYEYKAYL